MDVWGNKEAGDVQDLLARKDFEVTTLRNAYEARGGPSSVFTLTTWPAGMQGFPGDPDATWANDTNAMMGRYSAARANAEAALANASTSTLAMPINFDAVYEAILRAVQKVHAVTSVGDLQDVWSRLANQAPIAQVGAGPQPSTPDQQLLAYQTVDRGIRAGEKAARAVGAAIKPGVDDLLIGLGLIAIIAVATRGK